MYVVGNLAALQMETRRIAGKEVLMVALPTFASTGTAVVVNLESLKGSVMEFRTEAIDGEETKRSMEGEEEEEEGEEEFVIDENIENDEEWSVCFKKQKKEMRSGETLTRWLHAAAG